MRKWVLCAAVVVLIALFGLIIVASRRLPPASTWIALPDGTSVRVTAVTYGTNHVVGSKLGEFANHLPKGLKETFKRIVGQRALPEQKVTTPTPEFLVWLDRQTNTSGATVPPPVPYTTFLGDGSNFISGPEAYLNNFFIGSHLEALHFYVFPKRDSFLTLNFFYQRSGGGSQLGASLPFVNPFYHDYPQWQPEALPAMKRVGDLEVTLQKIESGHDNSSFQKGNRDGAIEITYGTNRTGGWNYTVMNLILKPLSNPDEVWRIAGLDVLDATGNTAHNSSMSWSGQGASVSFMPSLWPGENAWTVKIELKRSEGFRPDEIFILKNVPLGEVNRTKVLDLTNHLGEVRLVLHSVTRRSSLTNTTSWSSGQMSSFAFKHSTLPDGVQMDLLRVVWDTGKTNNSESWSASVNERDYDFHEIPLTAKTADITFAVQKSRFVEFTVKPELPK